MSAETVVLLDNVDRAIRSIAAGRAVVVVGEENEGGDLVFAASQAKPELIAFALSHSRGPVDLPMPEETLDGLTADLLSRDDPASTDPPPSRDVSVETTDRASAAIRVLAYEVKRVSADTRRLRPMRTLTGGVLARRRSAEAAVDLARLAGAAPVGAVVHLVNSDGTRKDGPQLRDFADDHDLLVVSVDSLLAHRHLREELVWKTAGTRLPTIYGDFTAHGYRTSVDGVEHVALVLGDLRGDAPVLTRIHSECLTGDAFGSHRCDCGPQLQQALERIHTRGRGVVVYLRGHEGRGIGLAAKLRAYQLQDAGLDTVDANLEQGLAADDRHYGDAAQILRDLGVECVDLLTNNPDKSSALEQFGIRVAHQVPSAVSPNPHNLAYLITKRDRMGHTLPGLDELCTTTGGR